MWIRTVVASGQALSPGSPGRLGCRAELGWKGSKGQGRESAAENWAGILHIVMVSGWNGCATTLDQGSWLYPCLEQ